MGFVIAFLIIFLAAAATSYLWGKRFAFTLPLAFAALELVLYIFSLLNIRQVGVGVYITATIVLAVLSIFRYRKKRDLTYRSLLSPEAIFVVLSMVVVFILTKNFVLNDWDEFAQWGLILKNLFFNTGLGVAEGTTVFHKTYPEGISLIQSLFNQFNSVFSEPNTLRALLFLSTAQLAIVYGGIKRIGIKKGSMIGVAITVLPYVFFTNFHGTIYIDAFIGLLIGNILFFDYIYKKKDLFYCVYMSLQLAFLANTKQLGIIAAGIICIVVIARWAQSRKTQKLIPFVRGVPRRKILYVLIPIILTGLVAGSWKLYVDLHNYKDIVDISGVSISNIKSVLVGVGGEAYRHVTYHNFVLQFFSTRDFGVVSLSFFAWTILLLVGLYLLAGKKDRGESTYPVLIIGGVYFYAAILLFLYLFAFIPYEAQMVASFSRYLGSMLLGVLMFTIYVLYVKYANEARTASKVISAIPIFATIFVLLTSNLSSFADATLFARGINAQNAASRETYNKILQYTPLFKKDRDKIYIISQKSDGHDYWRLRYILTPISTSADRTWSIGEGPLYDTDQWTLKKTAQSWANELQSYTYVYIEDVDETFIVRYGYLFEDESSITPQTLYRVIKTNGSIQLTKVTT